MGGSKEIGIGRYIGINISPSASQYACGDLRRWSHGLGIESRPVLRSPLQTACPLPLSYPARHHHSFLHSPPLYLYLRWPIAWRANLLPAPPVTRAFI
uniref:Uncharacterized protein n=1 Tax=Picea glauca TaxID=3330 RepID=A0A101LUH3_PICGL|nr:hypothetical protein ABT39_MTgene2414 [Picea glauca]QHR86765.1 hypothetical protein Q903MT_gene769 [Picea sitchensis]